MEESKKWWQSKTIVSSVVAMLAGVGTLAGLHLDASLQSQIVELVLGAGTVIAGGVAVYGRLTAKTKIA